MLRGVNRSIIEITQPDNKYFERVLVFVRPEYKALSETKLKNEAQKFANELSTTNYTSQRYPSARKLAAKKRTALFIKLGFIAAAAAAICILYFTYYAR